MVFRKLPEELSDKRPVIEALRQCRKVLNDAQSQVKPFCLTHRALSLVVGSIDTLAWFLTGSTSYFHLMAAPDPRDMEPRR